MGLRYRTLVVVVVLLTASARSFAQDDVLVKAREAATTGRRAEALAMLEARLAESPRDVDARLLYGLVLSWEGRYDDARPVLEQVLVQAPNYTDARVALMNVEYWSGDSTAARAQADQILSDHPGNVTARAIRERLEAAARPWRARTNYSIDAFSDDTDTWQEFAIALTRRTPVGSVILRGNQAARFGLEDQLIEVELYPRFRPGTYAFIGAGVATDATLYPYDRYSFDVYQSLGGGFEVSAGARFLDFGSVTNIYVATLTKYIGNWMWTGKVYRVPGGNAEDSTSFGIRFRQYSGSDDTSDASTSFHIQSRRYFGSDGTSYAGLTYSHGLSREEVRTVEDLATLDSDTLRGDFDVLFGTRLRIDGSVGTSHQERVNQEPVWQTTVTAAFTVLF